MLLEALRGIADPAGRRDIVAAGLVDGVAFRDGVAEAALLTDRAHAEAMEPVRAAAEATLAALPGVSRATVVLTAHHDAAPGPDLKAPHQPKPKLLANIGAVIAVASGKGGVGKSTVAVNLAVALSRAGKSVGLLDADVFGPSLPTMLGETRRPEVLDGHLQPIPAWGLATMSIGYLVEPDVAMVWRGPMVMGALEQLMDQVDWPDLDILIVDMPPGTGDAQLTISQRVALAGAVIVSTPQDIALDDARRGIAMFRHVDVPVLGLIENMSYFCCPECGARSDVFGHGGAREEARKLDIDFLGEIPLRLDIRSAGDLGTPVAASEDDTLFAPIAQAIIAKLAG
jgi:ATP-binding protein involved in chromosome partitioning